MIKIFTIILAFNIFAFAQNQDKNTTPEKNESEKIGDVRVLSKEEAVESRRKSEIIRQEYNYIADFIEKEFVKKSEKKVVSLEKEIIRMEKRVQITTNPKQKKALSDAIKIKKAELESLKIWPLYHKAYLIKEESYEQGKIETYQKARAYLKELTKRYQTLTASKFPNYRGMFYAKYGKKIQELREQKLNQ